MKYTSLNNSLSFNGITYKNHFPVNIIIVSDHGMSSTPVENKIEIDNFLNVSLVEKITDKGGFMSIKVPEENVEKVSISFFMN